jgi:hypothetical protein
MIAAIAGAELSLPPRAIRGSGRMPSDSAAVSAWLARETLVDCAGIVASAEFLAYGNLIGSRISEISATDALTRLQPLIKATQRGIPTLVFGLLTRVSNADDCVEEPLYWKEFGTRFYQYSQLLHKQSNAQLTPEEQLMLASLEAALPEAHRRDWLGRRARNHTVNLALIDLLGRGQLSFLLLTSDDTSQWGLPSREKLWLEEWLRMLGPEVQKKSMMHPGADEVGSALVARLLTEQENKTPKIFPLYAIPNGEEIIAPYEDRAVRLTVEGQIKACGGVLAESAEAADIVLGVLTPSPRRTEWRADFADAEKASREEFYRAHFTELARLQALGKEIALGDVAYPNGADPLAIALLFSEDCPLKPETLSAFGAWNTAGNSLGTTVAQAVVHLFCADATAQKIALTHHFLEGWGYQTEVRREARQKNTERFGHHDPDPDDSEQVAFTCENIAIGLQARLKKLQASNIGIGLRLAPNSVTLPWNRTFECDFALEPEIS